MPERPHLHHWFRLGYVARGLVFMGLGAMAWSTGRGQSNGDVIARFRQLPLGQLLIVALILALTGLGLFRLAEAWLDLDRRGSGRSALLQRVGRGFGALGYLGVAAAAAVLLCSGPGPAAQVTDVARTARDVRDLPGGGLILIVAGFVAIGAAFGQLAMAWHCRFMQTLSPAAPPAMRWLGRFGYAARGVVFFLIGWQLVRAGLAGHRIRDVAAVLDAIREHAFLFHLITGGLFLFGTYSLVEARYRRMPDDDELENRARAKLA